MPSFDGMSSGRADFPATLWSEVLAAGGGASGALQKLAESYWRPVYSWLRRTGRPSQDARDLTQGFFVFMLEGNVLQRADRQRGRFRTYLLACLKNFMADEFDRATALKRGGGRQVLSLDVESAERQLGVGATESPDNRFERQWALDLMEKALARLRKELPAGALEAFKLANSVPPAPNADIASRLSMTPEAVASAVYRGRARLREIVIEEVRATVEGDGDVAAELAELMRALSGPGSGGLKIGENL